MNWKNDKTVWYNPFTYIAGGRALLMGLLILLPASAIGTFSGVWFPGVLDIKMTYMGSFALHLGTSLMVWFISVVVLYVTALLLSPSRVRFLDMAGTLALARAPLLLATFTGFFGSLKKASDYWLYYATEKLHDIMPVEIPETLEPVVMRPWDWTVAITLMLVIIAVVIWMVALMFHAYRVSANLKGVRAGLSFGIGLFIAQIISNILMFIWILPLI
jgi:hypothetical protein